MPNSEWYEIAIREITLGQETSLDLSDPKDKEAYEALKKEIENVPPGQVVDQVSEFPEL